MKLSVLLSAMHLEDENYIDTLNITTDAVVINQCDRESVKDIDHVCTDGTTSKIRYIETRERGLSKSRNMALNECDSDICILCDNDVEYESGYDKTILDAYKLHPEADVIVFFVKRPERSSAIFDKDKRMGYLSVLKIFSPEISIRRSSIKDIRFDENFGAGAKYCMGEENLFLYECLKKHRKIIYVPKMIAKVRDEESTWFSGYTREFFISRGANYAAMSRLFSCVLIMQFALRKKSLYKETLSMSQAIDAMFEGRRKYLKEKGNS